MGDMGDVFRDMRQENKQRRGDRRQVASEFAERAAEDCQHYGVSLKVANGGAHWHFAGPRGMADWWPGTRKLSVGGKTVRCPRDVAGLVAVVCGSIGAVVGKGEAR